MSPARTHDIFDTSSNLLTVWFIDMKRATTSLGGLVRQPHQELIDVVFLPRTCRQAFDGCYAQLGSLRLVFRHQLRVERDQDDFWQEHPWTILEAPQVCDRHISQFNFVAFLISPRKIFNHVHHQKAPKALVFASFGGFIQQEFHGPLESEPFAEVWCLAS